MCVSIDKRNHLKIYIFGMYYIYVCICMYYIYRTHDTVSPTAFVGRVFARVGLLVDLYSVVALESRGREFGSHRRP